MSVTVKGNSRETNCIDWLRFLAIVLMIFYHFLWDLKLFDIIAPSFFYSNLVQFFGRLCLFLFLFCVGFSFSFSHSNHVDWSAFLRRFIKLSLVALSISLLTFLSMPSKFIYFGIIHHIVFASIVLIVMVRHRLLAFIIGVYVFAPYLLANSIECNAEWARFFPLLQSNCYYPKYWLFRSTVDYINPLPWLGCSLIGLGFSYFGVLQKIAVPNYPLVKFLSQHSLIIYIIHQPLLLAIVFTLTKF